MTNKTYTDMTALAADVHRLVEEGKVSGSEHFHQNARQRGIPIAVLGAGLRMATWKPDLVYADRYCGWFGFQGRIIRIVVAVSTDDHLHLVTVMWE